MTLSALAERLHRASAPPLVSDLLSLFEDADALRAFFALVKEMTPEAEASIRSARGGQARVEAFCAAFSRRWWPLDPDADIFDGWQDEETSPYDAILRGVPVCFMGTDQEDWESVPSDLRPGWVLLHALCASQFDDPDNPDGESSRVALVEAVAKLMGEKLAARIPEGGYSLGELRQRTAGTQFKALATLSEILNSETGNEWLDISQTEFYESYGGGMSWDMDTVKTMAAKHPAARAAWDQVGDLGEWLEEDLPANFHQLLAALEGGFFPPKEQLPLPLIEVFAKER